jgi:hypothetical protein
MTTILRAFGDGIGRVRRAPAILAGMFVLTVLLAVPPGFLLKSAISAHLGSSQEAASQLAGVNSEWWQEFGEQAQGLSASFTPSVIGFAAVLDNLSRFFDDGSLPGAVFWLAAAYILIWAFVVGGVIDRYARDRATRAPGFFAASGVFFVRFVRLGVVAWLVYGFLFGWVHKWLLVDLYGRAVRDMTVERTGFFLNMALYVVFGAMVLACNVVFDYAKIRAVVEDRRSMLGAVLASIRFVSRNPARVLGLVALDGLCYVAVVAAYAVAAPGAASNWTGFAVGQLYVLARLFVKLLFYASQTALFQGLLAHAAYTAAPQPAWPESPAVESISNAVKTG